MQVQMHIFNSQLASIYVLTNISDQIAADIIC